MNSPYNHSDWCPIFKKRKMNEDIQKLIKEAEEATEYDKNNNTFYPRSYALSLLAIAKLLAQGKENKE